MATLMLSSCACFGKVDPEDIISVTEILNGQNYGDSVYFKVEEPYSQKGKVYDVISEENFLSTIGPGRKFLYKWFPTKNAQAGLIKISTDSQGDQFKTTKNKTVEIIKEAGLPVYTSCLLYGRILNLFPVDEVNSGFVMGVVDSDLEYAYDMTGNIDWYEKNASVTHWDGVTYMTNALTGVERPYYKTLDDIGNKTFYADLMYGQKWIDERKKSVDAIVPTLEVTNVVRRTEKASITIDKVTYYDVTNKTIVISPDIVGLNSVLEFTYPKYSIEGSNGVYSIKRTGSCIDALTVHVITNGHWCANLTWKADESGTKSVNITFPVRDEFDDTTPFEVLVKTLNRKTGVR